MKAILGKLFFLSIILLFLSCKSAPAVYDALFDEKAGFPLDSGASVYIFADVKKARPIIDLMPLEELKDSQTSQMLDRTDFLAAAFFPQDNVRLLQFQFAAWGNYPQFWANAAFNINKDWKKQQTAAGEDYWYSRSNGMSISLNSKQAFAAATRFEDAPASPFAVSPFAKIPQGFNEFRSSSPLSLWMGNPAPLFSQVLKEFGVPLNFPVQQLFLSLYPAGHSGLQSRYEALIRMQFLNNVHARGMASLFSLAGSFMRDEDDFLSAVFFANPPVVNGNYIDIKTALLSGDEIALLLEMFLLYLD